MLPGAHSLGLLRVKRVAILECGLYKHIVLYLTDIRIQQSHLATPSRMTKLLHYLPIVNVNRHERWFVSKQIKIHSLQ